MYRSGYACAPSIHCYVLLTVQLVDMTSWGEYREYTTAVGPAMRARQVVAEVCLRRPRHPPWTTQRRPEPSGRTCDGAADLGHARTGRGSQANPLEHRGGRRHV